MSYLSNRCQSVKIHSNVSVPSTLKYGVLRGSVLSPNLFSMDTALLEKLICAFESLKHHFYADGTQIYCHNTLDDAKTTFGYLEKCLSEIQLWMNSDKLKFNPSNTFYGIWFC